MAPLATALEPGHIFRVKHPSVYHAAGGSRLRPVPTQVKAGGRNSQNGASPSPPAPQPDGDEDGSVWQDTSSIPEYMQLPGGDHEEMCESWEETLRRGAATGNASVAGVGGGSPEAVIWHTIRREAETDAASEPLLSSFLYASILSHPSFERSLSFVLSNRLSDATFLSTELFEVFYSILRSKPAITEAALADLAAVRERDPACMSYSQALLHFKGYHAIQAHRIAHELWGRGRRVMAVALQSRMSEVFAVDIHPAARFGKGILLDHGTGVVVGETAVLGDNVSILQNVTLGGTGKVHGDRHPKISDNVLIGASASILGNICVGRGAQVAAGSLVLKPVPPRTLVAGSPAKEIGTIKGNPALKMEQWCIDNKELLKAHLQDDPFATPTPRAAAPAAAAKAAAGSAQAPATPMPAPTESAAPTPAAAEPTPVRSEMCPGDGSSIASSSTDSGPGTKQPPEDEGRQQGAAAALAGEHQQATEQQQYQQQDQLRDVAASGAAAAAPEAAAGGSLSSTMEEEKVKAVSSDVAAQRKWPEDASAPPEYFI